MSKTNEQIIAEVRAEEIKRNMPNWNNEKIQAHMKAVPLDEHELRIENAIIEKARASGREDAKTDWVAKSYNAGKEKGFEAGKQSALAEIIELKEHLDLKDERIEELKQQLDDLKIKITHLESTLQFERGEMQERVRKLKERIENMYHKLGKTNVWRAGNDEVCDICEDYFKREIGEIFTDCAEQPDELNADFRKFAKKTLSGEKR